MSQIIESKDAIMNSQDQPGAESCLCDKKKCALGIASIAIGIGGFVLAGLL